MRILIAEDDQVLADGLLRTLRGSGAAVDHVGSGTEADSALAIVSSGIRPTGFSQRMCLPARAAARASSWWVPGGVATWTMSTFGSAISACGLS